MATSRPAAPMAVQDAQRQHGKEAEAEQEEGEGAGQGGVPDFDADRLAPLAIARAGTEVVDAVREAAEGEGLVRRRQPALGGLLKVGIRGLLEQACVAVPVQREIAFGAQRRADPQ